MTHSEYDKLNLPLDWSIYKDADMDVDDWVLDIDVPEDAPQEDGIYQGGYKSLDGDFFCIGVEIKDGKFVLPKTVGTAYRLILTAERYPLGRMLLDGSLETPVEVIANIDNYEESVHHYFIEAVKWKHNCFWFMTGS